LPCDHERGSGSQADEETVVTDKSDLKKHIRARQAKTGESYTTARMHVLRASAGNGPTPVDQADRITAIVLKCNEKSLRVRVQGEEGTLTLRCDTSDARRVVPAQLIEATITKRWTWRGDPYATGRVERAWTDIRALELEPLPLTEGTVVDLRDVYDPYEPPDPYADMWDFFASTPRMDHEFGATAWGDGVGVDPDDPDANPVIKAAEIRHRDPRTARHLLMDALFADLRCIEAHVQLANMELGSRPEHALAGYELAVQIGELSLPEGFTDMLPWGQLYNRPFLRALHGKGLCLWRMGRNREAQHVFERILSFSPEDSLGVRFCWDEVRRGLPWRGGGAGSWGEAARLRRPASP